MLCTTRICKPYHTAPANLGNLQCRAEAEIFSAAWYPRRQRNADRLPEFFSGVVGSLLCFMIQ